MAIVHNPILSGFHPDPSVLRVGEDYYIANSTFEWFPGVEISHSRDLVNWEVIAHPLNRESQLDLRGVLNGGGVWAPCLSYSDGIYYLIYSITRTFDECTQDTENYLVTARDIRGPWSERIFLNCGGFDPSLFHAPDGSKWLLNMRWDSRIDRNHFPGILMQQYSPEEECLIGEPELIFTGTALKFTEGPHMYYINGWYYLMTAEGGTAQGHAITMARSRSMKGPFELDPENPMLTTRNAPDWPIQYAGHGDIVQAADGEWYLFHLGSRKKAFGGWSVLGRETYMQNVYWNKEGWLRLKSGGNLPQEIACAAGDAEWKDPFFGEYRFDSDALDPRFMSLRIPADARMCSLKARSAWLRMYGQHSIFCQHNQSMIALRMMNGRFSARTAIDFAPELFQQMAGISLFYHTANFYYLYVSMDEQAGRCVQLMKRDGKRTAALCAPAPVGDGLVELRFDVNYETLSAFWRMQGAAAWNEIIPSDGEGMSTRILSDEYANLCGEQGFTGAFIALCCQDQTGRRKHCDFRSLSILPMEE